MSGILVVSNRGPLSFRFRDDGTLGPVPAAGGLASSLHGLLAGSGTTWASVTMGAADREAVAQGLMHDDGLDLVPVLVDDETYRQAYDVVANTTLWYVHHHLFDLPQRPRFDRHWRVAWEGYRAYNRAVADVVASRAGEGDAVLVQDYHFSLLGRMLAERRPDLRTVHFLHTPFADPAMFGVLPDGVAAEVRDGMAGYGACGFHCHAWEASFRACYAAAGGTAPPTFVAPLGPDAGVLEGEAAAPDALAAARRPARRGGRAAHRGAGRPHGALEEHRAGDARLRGAAARAPRVARRGGARRTVVPVAARAGRVSRLRVRRGTHGRTDQPCVLVGVRVGARGRVGVARGTGGHRSCSRSKTIVPRSLAALTLSDVLLVNPVRDGLNLVAKEGPLINEAQGALVLSHQAGAWEELSLGGRGALGVNPFDVSGTAEALHLALTMGMAERAERAAALRATVRARTSADWWADQLAAAG